MTMTARIGNRTRELPVISYSVEQAINSMTPGNNSGGTSSMKIDVSCKDDADLLNRFMSTVDQKITLTDTNGIDDSAFKGRGTWTGTISSASRVGSRISFSVDSLLNKLNVDKTALPYFGKAVSPTVTTYVINLATNPSGETGTTNYTSQAGTGGTVALSNPSPTGAFAGAKTVRDTWSVAATNVGGLIYTHSGITGGNSYTFSTYARTDSPQHLQLAVQWIDGSNANIGSPVQGGDVDVDASGWVRVVAQEFVAPSNAAGAKLYVFNYNDGVSGSSYRNWANGSWLEVDGWMISQGAVLYDFADGSFPNNSWLGTAGSSASQISVVIPQDPGYDATFANAFRYYVSLAGIPSTSITVDDEFEQIYVSYPGWTGNVLDHLKMMCAAQGAIFSIVNEVIQLTRPRQRMLRLDNFEDYLSVNVSAQGATRAVSLYNYNNEWLSNAVAAQADSVYSLTAGTPTTFTLNHAHSLSSVNSPVCVAAINPLPYEFGTGQYVVVDSNNNIVNPTAWTKAGGRAIAEINRDDPARIDVTIIVPTGITNYIAPYRLASYNGTDDIPAFYVTGTGVFTDKQPYVITTGATISETTQDSSADIDNIFLSNASQTHDAGTRAADENGGAVVGGSGKIPFDPDSGGQEFGRIAGARFQAYDNIFTITDATHAPGGISINYKMDVVFDDLTNLFSLIFAEFNATYSGLTFDQFNALYSGSTRTNLVTTPGLETGITGWSQTGATVTQVTTEKHSGLQSYRVVTAGSVVGEGIVYTRALSGMPGLPYSAGIWVKAPLGAKLYFVVRTTGAAANDSPQQLYVGTGAWQYMKYDSKIAQSDATSAGIQVRTSATAQAITFYVDDALIEQAVVGGVPFSGDTPNTPVATYAWTGTANASTSTAVTSGYSMNDFNTVSDSPTFDTLNAIYAGVNFNDHTVYPYLREAVTEDAEARF